MNLIVSKKVEETVKSLEYTDIFSDYGINPHLAPTVTRTKEFVSSPLPASWERTPSASTVSDAVASAALKVKRFHEGKGIGINSLTLVGQTTELYDNRDENKNARA